MDTDKKVLAEIRKLCKKAGLEKVTTAHPAHAVFHVETVDLGKTFTLLGLTVTCYAHTPKLWVDVDLLGGRLGSRMTGDGPIDNEKRLYSAELDVSDGSPSIIRKWLPATIEDAKVAYEQEAALIRNNAG